MNGNACNRGVVVASSGIDIASPVIDMDMLHQGFASRNFLRDKDMVLEQV